jgi:hypothetical protein
MPLAATRACVAAVVHRLSARFCWCRSQHGRRRRLEQHLQEVVLQASLVLKLQVLHPLCDCGDARGPP